MLNADFYYIFYIHILLVVDYFQYDKIRTSTLTDSALIVSDRESICETKFYIFLQCFNKLRTALNVII